MDQNHQLNQLALYPQSLLAYQMLHPDRLVQMHQLGLLHLSNQYHLYFLLLLANLSALWHPAALCHQLNPEDLLYQEHQIVLVFHYHQ